MKYDITADPLKIFATAIFESTSSTRNNRKNLISKDSRNVDLDISNSTNNNMNNNNYTESEESNAESNESSNKQCNEIISSKDSKHYNDNNKVNDCYNKKQDVYLNSQGMIDSIVQELTPVKLQQTILLCEIVGKPRSKTRRKRRF